MRNAYSIAIKCGRIIDKSICCNANVFSRRLTSETTSRSCTKPNSPAKAEIEEGVKRAHFPSMPRAHYNPLYLMDAGVARKIAAALIGHRRSKEPHVIQMYPGLGVLTKELLEAGMRKIHMYEQIEHYWPGLMELQEQYPDRLELHQMSFSRVLNNLYKGSTYSTNLLDTHFSDVEKRLWSDEANLEIIGSISTCNFVYKLVDLLFQSRLRQWGRLILYLCLPPSVSLVCIFNVINPCEESQKFLTRKLDDLLFCSQNQHLSSTNESYDLYSWRIVLFQTLFRIQILDEVPRSAFRPRFLNVQKDCSQWRRKIRERDNAVLYFVKVEAKKNLFDRVFTEMDMLPYYFFIRHHFKARTTRIIPALEKWLPGCGPALIKAGLDIYTEFGELRPHEARNLYVKFKSLPGYRASGFRSCVSKFFCDMEDHIALDDSSENIEEDFNASVQEFQKQKKKLTE